MTELATHREALRAFFRDRATVAAVVARRLLGHPRPDDTELSDHLIRQRRRRSSMDGSIDHRLVPTAMAVGELVDLGAPTDHAAVVRLSGYLLGRQDAPGRWGEADGRGTGFFSPGPIDAPIAPLTTYTGTVFPHEDEARFAASCLALRAVLRAGHENRQQVHDHLNGLIAIGAAGLPAPLAGLALAAMAVASPDMRPRVMGWVDHVARADDLTPTDLFAALAPVPAPEARTVVAARLATVPVITDADSEDLALLYTRASVVAGIAG